MVKGISKQIILVKPQSNALFEQAIFIVKDHAEGVSEKELLQQAQEATMADVPFKATKLQHWIAAFLSGAGCMGIVWLLVGILF